MIPDPQARGEEIRPRPHFWLERPGVDWSPTNQLIVSGWALDPGGAVIRAIRAVTDGQAAEGHYGSERPDVLEAFPERAESLRSGFSINLDLAPGIHQLAVEYSTGDAGWKPLCAFRHEVRLPGADDTNDAVLDSEPAAAGRKPLLFEGALERPATHVCNETGLLHVSGWIHFKEATIATLRAALEGGPCVPLPLDANDRELVQPATSDPTAACWFHGYLPIAPDLEGVVNLKIEAVMEDGVCVTCFERELTITRPPLPAPVSPVPAPMTDRERYEKWLNTNRLTPCLLRTMTADAQRLARGGPRISIVVHLSDASEEKLNALVTCLRNQIYPVWELCLTAAEPLKQSITELLSRVIAADSRIRTWATVHEPEGLTSGDFVGMLEYGDLLAPEALLHIAEAASADQTLDILYTDEDTLALDGVRQQPRFKGSFSPEMCLSHDYLGQFTVMRKTLVDRVLGSASAPIADAFDFQLRALELTKPDRVQHVPFICYHRIAETNGPVVATRSRRNFLETRYRYLTESLARRNIEATPFLPDFALERGAGVYQLRWSPRFLQKNPVTIIIPTKNGGSRLEACISSLSRTVQPGTIRLIIVDDFSADDITLGYLEIIQSDCDFPVTVIRPESPSSTFNFARLVNLGVGEAATRLVLLLNDDTEALHPGWLEDMAGWMSLDGVGAVGAKLVYPDHALQHAGVVVGAHGGLPTHIFDRLGEGQIGYDYLSHVARNVSAVTGACLLTAKDYWTQASGLDEDGFPEDYNDVDYCLRLGKAGKRIVFTPQAVLLHHCGASRDTSKFRPREHVEFLRRYRGSADPFYSENLETDAAPVVVNPLHFIHGDRVRHLKILMILPSLAPDTAESLFELACYFASTGQNQVSVVSSFDHPLRQRYEARGISVAIAGNPLPAQQDDARSYRERLNKLGRQFDVASYDLVLCEGLGSWWGMVAAKACRIPAIWHFPEDADVEEGLRDSPWKLNLIKQSFASAARVVFASDATRDRFAKFACRDDFITIHNSVDVERIENRSKEHNREWLRKKHAIGANQRVISTVRPLQSHEGQHILLEAAQQLQADRQVDSEQAFFLLVGTGDATYTQFLRQEIERATVRNVRIVEPEHTEDVLAITDILVTPAFRGPVHQSILTGMALKLAIVSTDVDGVPELISNSGEGLLFSPGDATALAERIRWLIQNPLVAAEFGEKAYSKALRLFDNSRQFAKQLVLARAAVAQHF